MSTNLNKEPLVNAKKNHKLCYNVGTSGKAFLIKSISRRLENENQNVVSILILVLAVLFFVGSCSTGKKIISVDDAMKQFERVYINTECSGQDPDYPQKVVITSDGERLLRW